MGDLRALPPANLLMMDMADAVGTWNDVVLGQQFADLVSMFSRGDDYHVIPGQGARSLLEKLYGLNIATRQVLIHDDTTERLVFYVCPHPDPKESHRAAVYLEANLDGAQLERWVSEGFSLRWMNVMSKIPVSAPAGRWGAYLMGATFYNQPARGKVGPDQDKWYYVESAQARAHIVIARSQQMRQVYAEGDWFEEIIPEQKRQPGDVVVATPYELDLVYEKLNLYKAARLLGRIPRKLGYHKARGLF
jgi:hypothetical protein